MNTTAFKSMISISLTFCLVLVSAGIGQNRYGASSPSDVYADKIQIKDSVDYFGKSVPLALKKIGSTPVYISDYAREATSTDQQGVSIKYRHCIFVSDGIIYDKVLEAPFTRHGIKKDIIDASKLNNYNGPFYDALRDVLENSTTQDYLNIERDADYISSIISKIPQVGAEDWVEEHVKNKLIRWNYNLTDFSVDNSIGTRWKYSAQYDSPLYSSRCSIIKGTDREDYKILQRNSLVNDSGYVSSVVYLSNKCVLFVDERSR